MKRDIYLALGDSITAGYNATHPQLTFVSQVGHFTQEHQLAKRTILVAKNGWTTRDIWNAAQVIHPTVWEQTNVLTLLTGGNDLRKLLRRQYLSLSGAPLSPRLISQRLQEFGFHMDRLCRFVARWDIPHVVVATVYNPVPNFHLGVEAIQGLNSITNEIAEHYRLPTVDVYEAFRDNEAHYIENYRYGRFEDLASPIRRPIHPNNAGHKEIADLVTEELTRQTSSKSKETRYTRPRSERKRGIKSRPS